MAVELKNIVVIYDQTDILKQDGVENLLKKYVECSGGGSKKLKSIFDKGTNSEIGVIQHQSGNIITFVNESLWVYDYDSAENKFGDVSSIRKSIALIDDIPLLVKKINNLFEKEF